MADSRHEPRGIGRELGPYALDAYLETTQIYINLSVQRESRAPSIDDA